MPSPILARADALMQRRRQGETGPLDDVPVLTDTVEVDEAMPILTNTVSAPMQDLLPDDMADILSAKIKARLAAELPALIEATVREFLAEQGQSAKSKKHG
jgi:hypothetical protein